MFHLKKDKTMGVSGGSSFKATSNPNNVWAEIGTSLDEIQIHCDQLLSRYHQLSSHEIIALIEAIEIKNFLLQELFAQIAPSSSTPDGQVGQ